MANIDKVTDHTPISGMILCMGSATERRRYDREKVRGLVVEGVSRQFSEFTRVKTI